MLASEASSSTYQYEEEEIITSMFTVNLSLSTSVMHAMNF